MKNLKQAILQSLSNMDIGMLELILDDSRTYQDATKETFLQKLNEVFTKFKSGNDGSLIPYSGACVSDKCNKGCKGYSFVGNNSNNHTDFIFEETKTDFKDIYHCSHFKIDNPEIELGDDFSLYVLGDDKADFKPSIEYLAKVQLCGKAYDELVKDEITYLSKDDYTYWLQKHYDLYQTFDFPPLFYNIFYKFHSLYRRLNNIAAYLKFNNEALKAIEDYNSFDSGNEELLLKWLVKYEQLGDELSLLLVDCFHNEEELKTGYVKLSKDYNLQIAVSDFEDVILFKQKFDEHYWDMLDKFSTVEESKWNNLEKWTEESEKSSSLKFHLERRRMFDE